MKQVQDEMNTKDKGPNDSDQEMLNLDKDVHSLTHYADDPEELVSQMFSSIKGAKLNAMLPPILKEIPVIDVQQLCLHELRGMSARRILSIINGVEMSDSSSDEDDLRDTKLPKIEDDERKFKDDSMDADDAPNDPNNLTEMDMLELEMRAKLIKTMLGNQPGGESGEEANAEFDASIKIKQEPTSSDEENRRGRKYKDKEGHSSSSSRRSSSRSSYSSSHSGSRSSSSKKGEMKDKVNGHESPKRNDKKKITKKEFEARMKKAKMNRSYRKHKESDEDSANDSKKRHRRKKSVKNEKQEETEVAEEIEEKVEEPTEEPLIEANIEGNEEEEKEASIAEEGEEIGEEKEEGEIDSNEEGTHSEESYSHSDSYSSSSRSRSSSRGRRRRHRHKRRSRKYKSRSPSVPKVPNWEEGNQTALPKKSEKGHPEDSAAQNLPLTDDRQSVSFALSKKPGVGSGQSEELPKKTQDQPEGVVNEGTEDFYKGADELAFSEEEEGALREESEGEEEMMEPLQDGEVEEEEQPTMEETFQDGVEQDEDATEVKAPEENMEIIGIIDPTAEMSLGNLDPDGSSWSTRWLQSEKVQQVVSDSKMMSKVRKNIQAKGKGKPRKATMQSKSTVISALDRPQGRTKMDGRIKKLPGGIGGNAEEYEQTYGIKVKVPQSLPVPKAPKVTESENKAKSMASTLLDSDDDDDSADDELWSKIMKK